MTFSELRTLVRDRIIVDQYEDAFLDGDINDALWLASVEIAAAFDIPQVVAVLTDIDAGDTSVTAPSDCKKVETLSVDGDDGRPADMQQVLRMRWAGNQGLRYFNFDPRRGGSIEIAPPSAGGTPTIVYVGALTRPDAGSFDATEAWNGVLTQFHSIIAYRAGIYLFEQEERENEVAHLQQEYQLRADEMSFYLGRSNMQNRLVNMQARNDEGAEG